MCAFVFKHYLDVLTLSREWLTLSVPLKITHDALNILNPS